MKNVLVFLSNGFEEIEAFTVIDVLRRGNVNCISCSIEEDKTLKGAQGIIAIADTSIDEIDMEFDAIIIVGGLKGVENLRKSKKVEEYIKKYNESKKIIGAICAAPSLLEEYGILLNKSATSYPGMLTEKNGNYNEDIVCISENIITSRGPATALEFSYEVLSALGLNKKSEQLKEGMLYNYFKNNI